MHALLSLYKRQIAVRDGVSSWKVSRAYPTLRDFFFFFFSFSAINIAKEDANFRRTLKISNSSSTAGESSCSDDVEESALIVSLLVCVC